MLKKYYIAFFLLMYSIPAYSSVWDDIATCFSDPCNCGSGTEDEIWNGKVKWGNVKPNPICAPWNKKAGRKTDNCLMQFEMPKPGIWFYLKYCAQKTSDSTYFNPKINVRTTSCNALACWSKSTNLKGNGECAVWAGAYAVPVLRICARIAMPKVPADALHTEEIPADNGYTAGKHLNMVGVEENDARILDEDDKPVLDEQGNPISFDKPKLCAYIDPGLVNLISASGFSTDILDIYPYNQPLHKTTKLHPIMQVLLFFLGQKDANLPKLLGELLNSLGADKIPGLNVLETILKQIGKLLSKLQDTVVGILKKFGSLNGDVRESLGCVEIPLGPFPPPYCPTLDFIQPTPTISTICSKKNRDGKFRQNSEDACVVSRLNNNIIHNVVRISLDNLVPLCKGKMDPAKTDQCVKINPSLLSAKDIHTATKQRDTIKPCPDPTGNGYCVDTKIPLKCSVASLNSCRDGFRIVYGQKIGKTTKPYDYYVDDLEDCGPQAAGNIACQEVWGINTGEFIDVPLVFTEPNPTDSLREHRELKDNNNTKTSSPRTFNITIAQFPSTDSEDKTSPPHQDPKSICVSEGNNLVGCVNRVLDGYVIKTSLCPPSPNSLCTADNKYFTPEFIAILEVLDEDDKVINSLPTVVTPLTIRSPSKSAVGEQVNFSLAGLNFSAFMAFISDDGSQYIAMPFSGKNAIDPLSRFGQYKDNKFPYDPKTKKLIPGGIYLSGLEYRQGKYIQGATHACLQPQDMIKCTPGTSSSDSKDPNDPPNPQDANCVLTKLTETDIVDCNEFNQIMLDNPTLRICQQEEGKDKVGCTKKKAIPEKENNRITIYECQDSVSQNLIYCYENNVHPGQELCKASVAVKDRIIPAASLNFPINKEEQHFVLQQKDGKPNYDNKIEAIRDKTLLELDLCVKYPIPTCPAITTPSPDSGNAIWDETAIGQEATGRCEDDMIPDPKVPLKRYCLSNHENMEVKFEPLAAGAGCIPKSKPKPS